MKYELLRNTGKPEKAYDVVQNGVSCFLAWHEYIIQKILISHEKALCEFIFSFDTYKFR